MQLPSVVSVDPFVTVSLDDSPLLTYFELKEELVCIRDKKMKQFVEEQCKNQEQVRLVFDLVAKNSS